jgi:ribose transport system ATP-binding protein
MAEGKHGDAAALAVRGLSKTFGATRALRNVGFAIARGEVHALVGQNGCGKSTLIKILAGFHEPDVPTTVLVNGTKLSLGDQVASHGAGLRFVHQDLGIVPMLDSLDNMALGFGYSTGVGGRVRWRAQARKVREALAELGYDFDVRTPLADLAPVERTAVAIARALQGIEAGLSLLVLDEPTATMPQPEVERLFAIIRLLRSRGVSILYVSHHLDEVYELADRVTVFRDGQLVATERVKDLPRKRLVELMVGDVPDRAVVVRKQASDAIAISLRGFGGKIIRDLDLDVHAGEVVGIAGITGSGREEFCETLFGGRQRSGEVTVDGSGIEPLRPDAMVAHKVGLVPAKRRDEALVVQMTVRENFTLPDVSQFWRHLLFGHSRERREVARLVKQMGVKTPGTEAGIDALSGGNQQKVVVGRWLRLKPSVLLLDEPTQGVDIRAKSDIHALIDDAAADGSAVIVASSDEAELERLCDRVLILRRGKVCVELKRGRASARVIAHESLGAGDGTATDMNEKVTT